MLAPVVCCLALACTSKSPAIEIKDPDPSLQKFVLDKLPDAVQNPTYVDFGGKVQLLGYNVAPADVAPPGSKVSLTMYWQRTGRLDAGWGLFTHILNENGRQLAQHDSSGPLRAPASGGQALGPSDWQIGKIYMDESEFEVPRSEQQGTEEVPLNTEVITLAVGVWKEDVRLDVLGSRSDRYKRCLVTNLSTGIERQPPPEKEMTVEDAAQVTKKPSDG
jgi:hypothetical protein